MANTPQFLNYLNQLQSELEAFSDDGLIWKKPAGINNSPGHLTLHLTGNLQHFIGAQLFGNGYQRNRDLEFSSSPINKSELLRQVIDTRQMLEKELPSYLEKHGNALFPYPFKEKTVTVQDALSHLLAHLAYHCGQINYFRRILEAEASAQKS
jgi:uncharacterized damage-inducible protein DinB